MNLIEVLDEEIASDGQNWEALLKLSKVYTDIDKLGHAYAFAIAALQTQPTADAFVQLGVICDARGQHKEALSLYESAHQIDDQDISVMNRAGQACLSLGLVDDAENWFLLPQKKLSDEEFAAANTNDLDANMAFIYLARQNYRNGWKLWNLGEGKGGRVARYRHLPKWQPGQKGAVVFWGEQGLGDQIFFSECLHDALADCEGDAIIEVDPRLVGLFSRSFPQAIVVGSLYQDDTTSVQATAQCSIAALPALYRHNGNSYRKMPYLKSCDDRDAMAAGLLNRMGKKRKIGISWTGGLAHNGGADRSRELSELMSAFKKIDADWISLEHTVEGYPENDGVTVYPFLTERALDYDYTASLVSQLDLVVSVPNTIVHTAGALGTPTIVLGANAPSWCKTVMNIPAYRNQTVLYNWTPQSAAKRIKETLNAFIKLRRTENRNRGNA